MTKIDKDLLREAIPVDQYYRAHLGEPQSDKFFCPFHDDRKTPNMTASEKGFKCFACNAGGDIFWFHGKLKGLPFADVLKELAKQYAPNLLSGNGNGQKNLPKKEVAQYDYRDEDGELLFQVVRYEPKDFRQRTPDGSGGWKWGLNGVRRVPYRLPELLASADTVCIPGGEKDCETLIRHGLTATTNPCGEGNWKPEFNKYLKGRKVVVFEDNDPAGRKHGQVVAQSLHGIAEAVKVISFPELPEHGDVSDYLQVHTKDNLFQKIKDASFYEPVKEESKTIQFPVSVNGNGLNGLMESAGVSSLTENSGPDEIIEAIGKLSATTANKGSVFLGVARSEVIKKLKGIGVQSPTALVNDALKPQKSKTVEGQGQTLSFEDPESWLNELDGAELLNEISETINRYVILPKGGDTALSLWVMFAWTHDAFQVSPLLDFRSPTKRCGKTTGQRVVKRLVPKPLVATNVSTPSLFRGIEAYSPTLLIDEVDTFLNRDQETNGILNGGHERDGAFVLRCEGDNHEPRIFSVWCPKVLSGIGRRKDTLEDRSIPIPMKRKALGQKVEKLPINSGGEFLTLRRKMVRWSEDNLEELREANPDIPGSLNDRAQDNWWPLLAIADLCGKEWAEKARETALILSGDDNQDEDTWGVQLLSDIRDYFKKEDTDKVSSEDLVKHLHTLEDRDWVEMGRSGKEISKRGVSRLLKPFDVKPKTIRTNNATTAKGYTKEMFEDAFFHYLPDTPIPNVTSVTRLENKELEDIQNVTNHPNVTDKKQDNLFKNNIVTDVTDKNRNMEEKKINEVPSYENGWAKKHFDDKYGNSQAVWEKGGLEVPV